ncbi:MAG: 2-amino-4-hydroxy-6-hydroxymethyldihydropteridine diphosphokinase [Bacteroidales bacterium]|nr:2-amino-4-hydroxy-6-hydroxymethyldihydropteridine diphosphokinase [Bacteroidales bacterium]
MRQTHRAVICLGSNTPDASLRIALALDGLRRSADVLQTSDAYVNDDDTGRGAPYTNLVAECDTTCTLEDMCDIITRLETEGGRTADSKATAVMPIDIDIVIWDGDILRPYDYTRPYFTRGYTRLAGSE